MVESYEYQDRSIRFNGPYCIHIDIDQSFYVADCYNHRIIRWENVTDKGQIVAGKGGRGSEINQLLYPKNVIIDKKNDSLIISDCGNKRVVRWNRRNDINPEIIISDVDCYGLAMDHDGNLYVSDVNKHEVRRRKMDGEPDEIVVAGGNGIGDGINQLNTPQYIFVDEEQSVYVSEYNNHRITKWLKDAKEGIVVAGGQGRGGALTQLFFPRGVFVDHLGTIYIVDGGNNRIVRWFKGAKSGNLVVGRIGKGAQAHIFSELVDLAFDAHNNLYIVDCYNHRIQKFLIDSSNSY